MQRISNQMKLRLMATSIVLKLEEFFPKDPEW